MTTNRMHHLVTALVVATLLAVCGSGQAQQQPRPAGASDAKALGANPGDFPAYARQTSATGAAPQAAVGRGEPSCPPAWPYRCAVACPDGGACECQGWDAQQMLPWQVFAQGEYVGPARERHVPEYRVRVDDMIEFVFRLTAEASSHPYLLNVGDTLHIASLTAKELDRDVIVEPDGSISVLLLGQVPAAGRSVQELVKNLDELYKKFVRDPSISVSPKVVNTRIQELRATVDNRAGVGGQSRQIRVTPEGTVQLPAIGSVPAQGLSLMELKREVDERYSHIVEGIEVTPILMQRAPRYAYVIGEVRTPGRITLDAPTTVMQAIAATGSWNVGANLRQIVVFRRDECWRLMATQVNLHAALFGKNPCPDDIWVRDSDVILVPKSAILHTDDIINLVFTRGIYGVVPFSATVFRDLSSVSPPIP